MMDIDKADTESWKMALVEIAGPAMELLIFWDFGTSNLIFIQSISTI